MSDLTVKESNEKHVPDPRDTRPPVVNVFVGHKRNWLLLLTASVIAIAFAGLSVLAAWRYFESTRQQTAFVHNDSSQLDTGVTRQAPPPTVPLVWRAVDGHVYRAMIGRSERDMFFNQRSRQLSESRDEIKSQVRIAIQRRLEAEVTTGMRSRVDNYADWYFGWRTSYIIFFQMAQAAINNAVNIGEGFADGIAREMTDYFQDRFTHMVLQPEITDNVIERIFIEELSHAQARYLLVMQQQEREFQHLTASHLDHLEELVGDDASMRLDWQSSAWVAPTYAMSERAYSAVRGGAVVAAATRIAPLLARQMNRIFGRIISKISARAATIAGPAVVVNFVAPGIGMVVVIALGLATDYVINEALEEIDRPEFTRQNIEAVDAIRDLWSHDLADAINSAVDIWFDDSVSVLASAQQP